MNKEVLIRLSEINEKAVEIKEEINSLDFRMDLGNIDARLYRMKRKTNMYELSLLDKEVDKIRREMNLRKMLSGLGVTFNLESINLN